MSEARPRRIAFVVPYGEASESFFPDTLLSWLSARARRMGHETRVIRVYYDGRSASDDEEVRRSLGAALDRFAPTDVLVERVFDVEPLLGARARLGARLVMVCRGDGFDPDPRFDGWLGRRPGLWRGRTRRTPTIGTIVRELDAWLAGRDASAEDRREPASPLPEVELDLAHEVIALRDAARLETPRLRTLFANSGCPYAADPRKSPFYAGLALAPDEGDPLSLLGCAFCPMGGDYERADEDALVAWVAEQARTIRRLAPATEGFVLSDQAPLPYLARVLEATASLGATRWLVAMRADVLVRERARLERTLAVAARHGQTISLYLTGFESFSDDELARYLKGTTSAELVRAVETMRELARAHPGVFVYGNDLGHSLILWSPWTRPDDLEASLRVLRAHGLRELFSDLGRNRLRLTHELPITRAAERDGAIVPAWPEGRGGAGRGKGYATERPWRFLDPETALAHRLAELLRERLGRETELAQLRAAVAFSRGRGAEPVGPLVARIETELAALEATLGRWLSGPRRQSDPRRGSFVRAEVVDLGSPCGCGRVACAERDVFVEPTTARVRLEGALARPGEAIVLAVGGSSLHPELASFVARIRDARRRVGLAVSDGRALADVARIVGSCDAISVDLASLEELVHLEAFEHARSAAREVRWLLGPAEPTTVWAPALARGLARTTRGAPDVLRAVVALDAVGLDRLSWSAEGISELAARACDEGLAFEVSPLGAPITWRERMVARAQRVARR